MLVVKCMREFFMNVWDALLRLTTSFAAGAAAALGGFDKGLKTLCVLMAFDYLSGLLLGVMGKSPKTPHGGLSGGACFRGLLKKGLTVAVILLCALLDGVSGQDSALRVAATWFYIGSEGISILENLSLLGVPVPRFLQRTLETLHGKGGEEAEKPAPP